MVKAFVDCLSHHDTSIFDCAFKEIKRGVKNFCSGVQFNLLSILGRHGCREIPNPVNLTKLIKFIAQVSVLMQPAMAIRSVIPKIHAPFWNSITAISRIILYMLHRLKFLTL